MDIVCIADTHGRHGRLRVPPGDVVIHAGDFTELGGPEEVDLFLDWFAGLPHPWKVFIAGNHEFYLEAQSAYFIEQIACIPGVLPCVE